MLLHERFGIFELISLQVERMCVEVVSSDRYNLLLRRGAISCCGESRMVHVVVAQR